MPDYTSAAAIAAYLGATFTAAQTTQAGVVATAVTALIDTRVARDWQHAGAIVDELQAVSGNKLYLAYPPVVSVEVVEVLPPSLPGGLAWTLLSPTTYSLNDPAHGIVSMPNGYNGYYARVDYTSAATGAPADVQLAATVLAADLMSTTLNPESAGAESVSVGQNDLTVRYAGATGAVSASVTAALRVIDSYRRVVLA